MTAIARSSFGTASRLLPGETAHAVRTLYAACRQVDDLADSGTHADPCAALLELREDLSHGTARSDLAHRFLELHGAHGMGLEPAGDLVAAVTGDLDHEPFTTTEMLMDYAQGVAGTVGLMMCDIFDVQDATARAQGAALGRAMQLTNIARDVQADARLGRRYLPHSLCPIPPHDLTCSEICATPEVRNAVQAVLQIAEDVYIDGLRGLSALPLTVRVGVAAAALTYRDIGRQIAANGYRPSEHPAPPGTNRRAVLSFQAVCVAARPFPRGSSHAA